MFVFVLQYVQRDNRNRSWVPSAWMLSSLDLFITIIRKITTHNNIFQLQGGSEEWIWKITVSSCILQVLYYNPSPVKVNCFMCTRLQLVYTSWFSKFKQTSWLDQESFHIVPLFQSFKILKLNPIYIFRNKCQWFSEFSVIFQNIKRL